MSGRYLNCFGSVNRPASYAGAVEEQRAWFGRRVVAFLIDWFASVLVALLAFPQFPYGSNGSMLATLAVFVVEITVLMVAVFTTFFIGEHHLGVSGVLAVVTLGVALGRNGVAPFAP